MEGGWALHRKASTGKRATQAAVPLAVLVPALVKIAAGWLHAGAQTSPPSTSLCRAAPQTSQPHTRGRTVTYRNSATLRLVVTLTPAPRSFQRGDVSADLRRRTGGDLHDGGDGG